MPARRDRCGTTSRLDEGANSPIVSGVGVGFCAIDMGGKNLGWAGGRVAAETQSRP